MNQMPLECQSRIMVETSNFALSSSHSLRRDVYEKDVRLYWYEGGLRAKKLNFGQSLTPTCMRNSHIDIYHIIYNLIYITPTSPLLWLWGTQKESQKISVLLLLSLAPVAQEEAPEHHQRGVL